MNFKLELQFLIFHHLLECVFFHRVLSLATWHRLERDSNLAALLAPATSSTSVALVTAATSASLQLLPHAQLFRKVLLAIVYAHATLLHCQLNDIRPMRTRIAVRVLLC